MFRFLLISLVLFFSIISNASDKVFYFTDARYTQCATTVGNETNWKIEGPVHGPWVQGRMIAAGKLLSIAENGNFFDFATDWRIVDQRGETLMTAECKGTSALNPMANSVDAPWWEECIITQGTGDYEQSVGGRIITAGFAPKTECIENETALSGYKYLKE